MAFDAALLIRTGGALLCVAAGAAVLVLGRRRRENLLLGTTIAAYGAALVMANVAFAVPAMASASFALYGAADVAVVLAAGGLAWAWRTGTPRLAIAAGGLLVLTGFAVGALDMAESREFYLAIRPDAQAATVYAWTLPLGYAREASLSALGLLLAFRPHAPGTRRLAVAFALLVGWGHGLIIASGVPLIALVAVAHAVTVAAAWLAQTSRVGRIARDVALATLAIPVLAGLTSRALGEDGFAIGTIGLARAVAAALIAGAVFRHGLLDVPLPSRAARRGAAASLALATLFVVAQIAQNFLSAEYGLLTGGIAAGALLFAAHPIQRTIERLAAPLTEGAASTPAARGADATSDAVYRAALRAALHDGAMTPQEELHLAEVAQHLGIGTLDALRLRREVEREIGQEAR